MNTLPVVTYETELVTLQAQLHEALRREAELRIALAQSQRLTQTMIRAVEAQY